MNIMWAIRAATILIAITLMSSLGCTAPPAGSKVGEPAPSFDLKDINGKDWSLEDLRGKVVFVNFWASWCPPCKEELPSIQRLYDMTKDNPRFQLVTILYNDNPATAYSYLKQYGYNLPLLIDPRNTASKAYGITGVPETYIIDKRGILRDKVIGPAEWDSPGIVSSILQLTNQ